MFKLEVEEFKVTKVYQTAILENNRDEKRDKCKYRQKVTDALNNAEGRLRQSNLAGNVTQVRLRFR